MRDRGFEPCVAAPENLRALVERTGAQHAPLHGNSQAILGSGDGQRMLRPGNILDLRKAVAEVSREIDPHLFASGLAAVQEADAIVGGTLIENLAFTLARVSIIQPRRGRNHLRARRRRRAVHHPGSRVPRPR